VAEPGDLRHLTMVKSQACLTGFAPRSIHVGPDEISSWPVNCHEGMCDACVAEATDEHLDTAAAVCDSCVNKVDIRGLELAPLNFVCVRAQAICEPAISCLADSGSELNVIRSNVVSNLCWEPIGEVSLKGIIGKPVCATLVQLHVQLADDILSSNDYVALAFAIGSELNETCILSIPAVDVFNDVLNRKLTCEAATLSILHDAVNVPSSYVITRSQAIIIIFICQ
jgi:hypothetical protein